jgi:hypothetical protein
MPFVGPNASISVLMSPLGLFDILWRLVSCGFFVFLRMLHGRNSSFVVEVQVSRLSWVVANFIAQGTKCSGTRPELLHFYRYVSNKYYVIERFIFFFFVNTRLL